MTEGFGRNCLLARRLLERGVRFVQLIHGGAFGSPRINWDGHEDIVDNHTKQAAILDKPVAGLLKDSKRAALWTTRSFCGPRSSAGRRSRRGLGARAAIITRWLSLAGWPARVKKGFRYGASDEVGYHPAQDATSIYDFHATVLHLLGLDHKKLTFYHNGIQRRLTDVHGEVIDKILRDPQLHVRLDDGYGFSPTSLQGPESALCRPSNAPSLFTSLVPRSSS